MANGPIISPEQLQAELGDILQTFAHDVVTLTDEATEQVAKDGARLLTDSSPRRTGKYAKSWGYKRTKKGVCYIYNKKYYRLTHLLEKGHRTRYKTGKYGSKAVSLAIPHISRVEDMCQQELPEKIRRGLQYQH